MFEKREWLLIFLTLYFEFSSIDCNDLTQEELCSGQFTSFKVKFAFKIGKYITLCGQFWRSSESESQAKSATVRVLHLDDKSILNISRNKSISYFDAKVWKEIQDIENQKKIRYAFSTDNMIPLFEKQKMSETVFMVEETNITTAYQFDYQDVEAGKEPTFDISEQKKVFDPKESFDETDYLNLKFLLIHFPDQLRIISVLIFDRIHENSTHALHYAIVYTEEIFEGKPYYFRHYMRSNRHEYIDFKGKEYTFYRLDWFFDENINYCDEMSSAPTAVVMLSKRDTFLSFREGYRFEAFFAEFYGLKHKVMKITFDYNQIGEYLITEENSGQEIPNVDQLINCEAHPLLYEQKEVTCKHDYPEGVQDGLPENVRQIFESQDGNSSSFLLKFGLILMVIAVLVLIGVGLYIVVKPLVNEEN